jgi:hypothetical protein
MQLFAKDSFSRGNLNDTTEIHNRNSMTYPLYRRKVMGDEKV